MRARAMVEIVLGAVAVGAGALILVHYLEQRRTSSMFEWSERRGFNFQGDISVATSSARRNFELFSRGVGTQRILNGIKGEYEGFPLFLFDFRYTTGSGRSRATHRRTVVLLTLKRSLPSFTLRPEHVFHKIGALFGYQDIDFVNAVRFSSRYLLQGADEPAVRHLFRPQVLDFFSERLGFNVEGEGKEILVFRDLKRAAVRDLDALLEDATRIAQILNR
jgi:hypothetical protein